MANCRATYSDIFQNLKDTVTDAEWLNVRRMMDAAEKVLGENGIDFKTAVDDLKAGKSTEAANKLERMIDEQLTEEARDIARRSIADLRNSGKNIANLQAIKTRATFKRGKNEVLKSLRALHDLVTSPAEGSVSLGGLIKSTVKDRVNLKLYGGMKEKFGNDYVKKLDDATFRQNIAREYYGLVKNDKTVNTGDTVAKQYAQHIFDTLNEQRGYLNQMSGTTSYRQLGLPIAFNWKRVGEIGRDDFVTDFSNALDPKTHGDSNRRTQIAQQVYDELDRSYGNLNWDKIGDLQPEDTMGALSRTKGYPAEPVIEFNNADDWFKVNEKYGSQDLLQSIESKMISWSRKEAAVKRFGPDPKANLQYLINVAQDGTREGAHQISRINAAYKRLMEPVSYEWQRASMALSVAKNMEAAAHTGGALLSHLTAAPFISHISRTVLNTGGLRGIAGAFTGGLSHDAKDIGRMYGVVADHMLNHMNDQFGLDVQDGYSKSVGFSSNLADRVVRVSGLDWMMNSLKAGSLGVIRSVVGDHLSNGTQWTDLPKNFRASLEKFEIGQGDWNGIGRDALDEHGLFDMFRLPSEQSNTGITLYDKMGAWIKDNVDSMVISPNDRDFAALRPFEPGSAADLAARTITQFKVYPVAIYRRIIYRTLTQQEDSMARRMGNLAALTAMAVPVAALKVQANQVLSGKDPYKWDAPDLWVNAVAQTGLGGTFYDVLGDSGVFDSLMKSFGGQETSAKDYSDVLGPVASDMLKLLSNGAATASYGAQALAGNFSAQGPFKHSLSATTKQLLGSVPGQNLWYTSLLYQSLLSDTVREAIDPIGYRNARNRLLMETKNRANSFIDPSTPLRNQNIIARGLQGQ